MGMFNKQIEKLTEAAGKQLQQNMKVLEDHMITVQANQCEQEAYLSLIAEKLKITKGEIELAKTKIKNRN